MNRSLSLIALAAFAVVGVAAGALLLLGGQSGPLLSDLVHPDAAPAPRPTPRAPAPTTISLALSSPAASPSAAVLVGALRDRDGAPVASRPVELDWWDDTGGTPRWRAWYANPMATTLADGSFSLRVGAQGPHGSPPVYRVRFAGDPFYAASASDSVTVAATP